jgi:hypothetical protein
MIIGAGHLRVAATDGDWPSPRFRAPQSSAPPEAAGFRNYELEWWHYTLRDEPFPETFFDFPVSRRALD